jgi:hypothetical protein
MRVLRRQLSLTTRAHGSVARSTHGHKLLYACTLYHEGKRVCVCARVAAADVAQLPPRWVAHRAPPDRRRARTSVCGATPCTAPLLTPCKARMYSTRALVPLRCWRCAAASQSVVCTRAGTHGPGGRSWAAPRPAQAGQTQVHRGHTAACPSTAGLTGLLFGSSRRHRMRSTVLHTCVSCS